MRNTKDAIKYGIETLNVSPEKMFNLIESSRDYSGESYSRWLANEIIKIAEKDGIGYSQLLVKKFSIIQSILKECSSESVMSEYWKNRFVSEIGCKDLYTVDMPEGIGTSLDSVDWFNGIDYDSENSEFTMVSFSGSFVDKFLSESGVGLFVNLNSEPVDKSCDLCSELKFYKEVSCKNTGALMLYRLCCMTSAFSDSLSKFRVAFLCPVSFLYDSENSGILSYFLQFFKYRGYVVSSDLLYPSSYMGTKFAFVICDLRGSKDFVQDGFCLEELVKGSNGNNYVRKPALRYSRSSVSMLDELSFSYTKEERAIGYLCDRYGEVWISSSESESCIPITKSNITRIVAFYGVYVSKRFYGFSGTIPCIVDGSERFMELFYNCFPLFLYDVNSKFVGGGGFDILNSKFVESVLEKGQLYFGYEAKELLDVCRCYFDKAGIGVYECGLGFSDVRKNKNDVDLDNQYMSALRNLKDYICTLYRKIE